MTLTPHAAAARAPRTTGARIRAVLAVVASLGLLGGAPIGVAAARADTSAASVPEAGSAPASRPLEFRIAAEADGILGADGELQVTMSVDNPGFSTVGAGQVDITVSRTPLRTRAQVSSWLAGDTDPALRRIGSAVIDSIAARGQTTVTKTVEPGDDLEPGVYALRGTYASAQGTLEARGVWTVADDGGTGQVAVVVPITAPARATALLTRDELAELTAPTGSLSAQLNAVVGTDAILAVDPAIVAAIRVLGTTAPESATRWLQDLLTMPQTRFALQYGDADLAVQFNAGLREPLTVDDLAPELDLEGFSGVAPEPSPSPASGVEGQPTLPDIDALTDIGRARSDVFWPAGGTAGRAVVAGLGEAGDSPAGSLTLVPSDTVRGERGPRAVAGDAELLVYDADISEALHAASTSEVTVDRDASLAEAAAYATFSSRRTPLLVTVDRADDRSATALRTTVRAASRLDGRTAIGMERLLTTASSSVRVDDIPADDRRVSALTSFLSGEADLTQFASILEDPAVLLAPERAEILQIMGNGWLSDIPAWSDAVTAHRQQTRDTLDAVSIVPSPDINLLGSSAPLTFAVRNALPWPVSLVLITEPNDLRLVVQRTTDVTVGESQTTRVDVPVEARVGNGESSLSLQLRSRTMIPISEPITVTISVQAEWEGVGIVVMTVLVSVFLLLGVIRTVLRMRKRRADRRALTATARAEEKVAEENAAEDAARAAAEEKPDA